jgi:micrococcal nuclease
MGPGDDGRTMPGPGLRIVLLATVVLSGCLGAVPSDAGTETVPPGTAGASPATTADRDARTPVPSTRPRVTVTVVSVVDGDTVRVRYRNGSRETVRLLGVDTPEVRGETTPGEFEGVPDTEAGRRCLRAHGDRASAYARERLAGRTVRLGFDDAEGRRGFYDRLLAYVYVDGRQFNYELVVEGHARLYDGRFLERERYAAAEARARSTGRGLWSCAAAGPATTADTGAGTVALRVTVAADAPGNDNENLDEEYVVLHNGGAEPLDLGGWTVADEADHRYTFPAGTTLDPGASLTLHTGTGRDGDGHYYWGRSSAVWNNDGDTVTVRTDGGSVAARESY